MDVNPRKFPQQSRAKASVDPMIEASIQLLLDGGYERFTTARAAERAGVSVGSLYQYFPNKAALASAVIARCCDNFLIAFNAALSERHRVTLSDCVAAIVEVTLISHHLTPELHRVVFDLAPRIGVEAKTQYVSETTTRAIEGMLRSHTDEISPDIDIPTAAVVIETLLSALAHRELRGHPAHLGGERLAREASRLITNYLTAPDSATLPRA
jgi:AcrR family transcriptional regulator